MVAARTKSGLRSRYAASAVAPGADRKARVFDAFTLIGERFKSDCQRDCPLQLRDPAARLLRDKSIRNDGPHRLWRVSADRGRLGIA